MGDKQKPVIIYEGKYTAGDITKLKRNSRIWEVRDIYDKQLSELFEVTCPHFRLSPDYKAKRAAFVARKKQSRTNNGNWIYFPWNGILLHMVNEEDFHTLRTNRNKNLITSQEQKKLLNACVGVIGLSIGAEIALSLSYGGIGNTMKLADFDTLETTNLNRRKARVYDVGDKKTTTIAKQVYEANPYAKLILYKEGLTGENLHNFFNKGMKPTVVFDTCDDFQIKILLRIEARSAGIPIIMLTNLGDNLLVDVERYDLHDKLPLFNGVLGNIPEKILAGPISEKEKAKYAVQIVGARHVPERALESISQINKTLIGRPQLNSTVTVASGLASYLAKQIVLGKAVLSARKYISFNTILHLGGEK